MADTFFIEGLNTLPEQVQLNKEDIKTNTADITKLKDDIGKIKPNAWEERKFIVDTGDGSPLSFSTYNPITNESNPMVNIQRAFTDKETYSLTDKINSFSFSVSSPSIFAYLVCGNPSLTLNELFGIEETAKNYIVLANTAVGEGEYWLLINCRLVDTFSLFTSSLSFDRHDNNTYIDKISIDDDKQEHSILTAKAVDQYYLKKTDASTTYATKTELSNANKRIDALDTGTFDVDLTTAGLAKIKANVTIGTSITLTKDTDFSEYLDYTGYKTVIFTLYIDNNEEYFISTDIKLDVGDTADVYGGNDQNYTWLTGIGVIKLGPDISGSNYLCYISYSQGYTSPLVITPIQKLA